MILPEIGKSGQIALKNASVLIVGAGGLGCPAIAYLAGAGIGCLGIIDGDTVALSNCHRQILHSPGVSGQSKVDSAAKYVQEQNHNVEVHRYGFSLTHLNCDLFSRYDLVLDCTDNQATRYLISDTCVSLGIPLISGAALKTEGQLAVYNYRDGPCYRCLFPVPTPAEDVQSCGEAGILGPVVGLIGVLQALECIRLLVDKSRSHLSANSDAYSPSLTLFSAFGSPQWRTIRLRKRKKDCISCGSDPKITAETIKTGDIDYDIFCGPRGEAAVGLPADQRLEPTELSTKAKDFIILDVRDVTQFEIAHLDNSINVPIQAIDEYELKDRNKSVLVVCRIGNDSQSAVQRLQCRYPEQVFVDLRGGLRSYALKMGNFPLY